MSLSEETRAAILADVIESKDAQSEIAASEAVEAEAVVFDTEAAITGEEAVAEIIDAESFTEDQAQDETAQDAAYELEPSMADIYRAQFKATAEHNAQLINAYGASLCKGVPSATEAVRDLICSYQTSARQRLAGWR